LPIGSIYTSFEKTDPGSIFGGTWEPIVDKFIYGRGTNYALNSTGGEATHKLTVAEMPAHTHGASYTTTASNASTTYRYLKRTSLASYSTKPTTPTTAVGGNVAHENMPPYVVAYAWQRVG
jgi:microcystin-dependent protein